MSKAYDLAHELAKLIEEDENYIKVRDLTEKVMGNEEHMSLINNFREKQFQLQEKQMQNIQPKQEEIEETSNLYEELISHEEIKELVMSEERLRILYEDINKILAGPFNNIYGNQEENEEEEVKE